MNNLDDNFQLWSLSGESCPEGTVPIRRIKEDDMLRASSINTFGRKLKRVRRDTIGNDGHEVLYNHRTQQNLRIFVSQSLLFSMSFFLMVIDVMNE
jgi:hypothetical protein